MNTMREVLEAMKEAGVQVRVNTVDGGGAVGTVVTVRGQVAVIEWDSGGKAYLSIDAITIVSERGKG